MEVEDARQATPFRQAQGRLGLALLWLVFAGCQSSKTQASEGPAMSLPSRVHGANVRPVGDPRRGYGSDKAKETLARLAHMGVNTIGVLLEGRVTSVEAPEVRPIEAGVREDVRAFLRDAADLGFATILVPHLYVDDGSWRGYLDPREPAERARFFDTHAEFIRTAASDAAAGRASAISIGVELKALSGAPDTAAYMRALARDVRSLFEGQLTYSANWDEAESVAFWDAVDLAGVNGYYPLEPDPERGAEAVARRLTALSARTKKDVLVLEAGYRSGPLSYVRPWEWPEDVADDVDLDVQAKTWAAVLSSWPHAKGVRGLMLWIVPTDPDDPASEPPNGFSPINKPAEEVIRRAFQGGRATDRVTDP